MTARIAKPLARAGSKMRMLSERNHAGLMDRLVENSHSPGRLDDLITIAIVRRDTGQCIPDDTTRANFHVLRTIVGAIIARTFKTFLQPGPPYFALRGRRRHFPIRRIVDKGSAAIRPGGIVKRAAFFTGELLLFFRAFLLCHELSARPFSGTLERRYIRVGPRALQIRIAPRSPPFFVGRGLSLTRRRLGPCGYRYQQPSDDERGTKRHKNSNVHVVSPHLAACLRRCP